MTKLIISAICLLGLFSVADDKVNENPVHLTATFEPARVNPGSSGVLVIDVSVDKGHMAYRDMFKISFVDSAIKNPVGFDVSPTHIKKDKFSGKEREIIEGKARITAPIEFPVDIKSGSQMAKINIQYQACSKEYCLFPKTMSLEAPLEVVLVDLGPLNKSAKTAVASGSAFEQALAKGIFWVYLFVFVAGFLTSLTPCVYPMIPITISIIGARASQGNRGKAFTLSVSYVLGIATTYSLIGALAAKTGASFGSALGNIYVVGFVSVIFVAMAFSMFGFYEMQVPAVIRNKLGNANTGSGFSGAYFSGLFAGIVASPCIGPVLVSIFTYVAQTANVLFGFTLFFTFAMGLGILFIVLGTFSGLMTTLPKAGGWMEDIKNVFGYVFIGMALYYLNPFISKSVFTGLMSMLLIVAASHLGAFAPAELVVSKQIKKGLLLAIFAVGVLLSAPLIMKSTGIELGTSGQGPTEVAGLPWEDYSESKLSQAKGKPVIVDFFAEWCAACKELEHYTYTDPKVMAMGRNFTLLKIDATNSSDPVIKDLMKKYSVIGLPTVLFLDKDGNVQKDLTLTGFETADQFLVRMNSVQNTVSMTSKSEEK